MTDYELRKAAKNNKLPPLICLYGEEAFLLEECLTCLLDETLDKSSRDFNLLVINGRDVDPASLMDTAKTFPVFVQKRMIIVKQAQDLLAHQLDNLISYISDPVPECCMIFCANKVDKRKKFYQQFKKNGVLVEFKSLYANKIPPFVCERARSANKQFSEDGLALFCRRVGNTLGEIVTELNKLFNYCGDNHFIDVPDVAAVVSDTRIDSVFDLTDAIGAKDLSRALILLERLQDDGEAPLKILAMITRHYRQLWKTSALLEQNVGKQQIASTVKINPYFLTEIIRQTKKISKLSYPQSFELFIKLDLALKSTGAQPRALLQKLAQDLICLN
ncbi:MAG: DNA polymerase III subunit delta [Desulfobacteraceae bacterium 4572_35.1]|nr:MAG: DNA polymerase III subunit delta [Desulfobacteraceae bacterium 4572_35.1]